MVCVSQPWIGTTWIYTDRTLHVSLVSLQHETYTDFVITGSGGGDQHDV